ncbi:MAG: ribonuclease Y [Gemmatimonadota bacterium]|nr:ribonuclease Y [Gemmatimonadota bacterium]
MPQFPLLLIEGLIAGLVVATASFFYYSRTQRTSAARTLDTARQEAQALIAAATAQAAEAASKAAEAASRASETRNQVVLEGKLEVLRLREELDKEAQRRREESERAERRAEERERSVERKLEEVRKQEEGFTARAGQLDQRDRGLGTREAEIDRLIGEQRQKLERIAGLTGEEARAQVLQRAEDESRSAAQALGRDIREQAKRSAEKDAKKILALAVQRISAEHTAETTVSAVTLPSDEMKGRIIGREGRNIRAFELATGVDVIIDDTPDTVVVSCFDPIRREVARRSLEALIVDGRIHPGRIEELVAKAQKDLASEIQELGEKAAFETGVHGLHPELIKLIGRMRWRTSYGQNIYEHSKEVAWLAGILAAELRLDVLLAKRGALLHDVGKVLTHESEGTHVELGVEMARKYGESAAVINCIQAHHDDVPHESAESVLVQAADAISGSRPGARREAFESYVKRLTALEAIANSFTGVEKSNVIQAGREVRVIVTPDRINDAEAIGLSDQIARRIEQELQYPGQIKVVVIRETRAVDIAK